MTNVVIGAGSGMGTEVAKALAPRGPLVVADVNLESVQAVADELGGDVTALACDVTDGLRFAKVSWRGAGEAPPPSLPGVASAWIEGVTFLPRP